MADQWSAQAVYEHFLHYSSMASVAILTDDCITQTQSTQTLPVSTEWAGNRHLQKWLHTRLRGGGSFLFLPVYQTSVSLAQTRQPVGLQETLKWSCSWQQLPLILFYCRMCLNAYLYKERGEKNQVPLE